MLEQIPSQNKNLWAMGGLYESQSDVLTPKDNNELQKILEKCHQANQKIALIGGQRSFGEHFIPSSGAIGIDLKHLNGKTEILSQNEDVMTVRVSGGMTFESLCKSFPGYLPYFPPTTDDVTIAGAISSCTHCAIGFFSDHVKRMQLLTIEGKIIDCHEEAQGLGKEIFNLIPGSFGAFGVILEVELILGAIKENECAEINVVDRCEFKPGKKNGYPGLRGLEEVYQNKGYDLGRGLFFFGSSGTSVLFGDRKVNREPSKRLPVLPLTDGKTDRNIVLQSMVNRFPSLYRLQLGLLKKGKAYYADLLGFRFYQKSYGKAYSRLKSKKLTFRFLRTLGVNPKLPVCHQSFVIDPTKIEAFLNLYFDELRKRPEVEKRIEQQDLIRLPKCQWPLHGAYGLDDGSHMLSVSFSIRKGEKTHSQVREFLMHVSQLAYEKFDVKVLLLKQFHCELTLIQKMHSEMISRIVTMKKIVDPKGLISSKFLEKLLSF